MHFTWEKRDKVLADLHVHGMAHGEFNHSKEAIRPFIEYAESRGLEVLGFAEHDWFLEEIKFELIRSLQVETPVSLRVGLEVDHRPGLDCAGLTKEYPFDYLIGSVHEIDGFLFDHPDYIEVYEQWDSDLLYAAYFERLEDLIESDCYDIVGHFDLIKVFGCRPKKSILPAVTDLLQLIKQKHLVVEVNTSGRYKPAGEKYPSDDILLLCRSLDIPITLGSDAHMPRHVGRDLADQVEALTRMGFREIVTFKGRKPEFHSL
ncbi:MAG: histidinol-phosphatase HisJ family protein [Bacillota bacterium]|jgi:histidinol-phosphatase (PHP family)